MVHALCTRWAGVDAADDLTQQVFVAAWSSRHSYDPDRAPLGAWLVGVTRNVTNRSFRGTREVPVDPVDVARGALDGSATRAGATSDPRHEPDASDNVADELLLADALAALPDNQRLTLQLSYWEGLTQAEVAERLQMPLGTVKSHQRRGLQRLRDVLGGGS
jgi:RNA polymerase sigma factor (sigma-70 family)